MPLPRLSARIAGPGQYTSTAQMSRQVTLYQPGQRNASDGSTAPPDPFVVSWAAIRALGGDELDKAQQIAQETTHLVAIPYQRGITEAMLVNFEGRFFQIKYIEDPDEMHWELRLFCAEIGQNAGQQS